jgi:hypothetical protein
LAVTSLLGDRLGKLRKAKTLADTWVWQADEALRSSALCAHFDHATPHQLIAMWESGKNLQGRPLSQFETQALAEAWCHAFKELPPDCAEDGEPDPIPEPELPPDDTMLRANDA